VILSVFNKEEKKGALFHKLLSLFQKCQSKMGSFVHFICKNGKCASVKVAHAGDTLRNTDKTSIWNCKLASKYIKSITIKSRTNKGESKFLSIKRMETKWCSDEARQENWVWFFRRTVRKLVSLTPLAVTRISVPRPPQTTTCVLRAILREPHVCFIRTHSTLRHALRLIICPNQPWSDASHSLLSAPLSSPQFHSLPPH